MKIIELPFTTVEVHDNYVIGRTNEGVHLCMEKHLQVLDTVNKHLTSPYGLILDETNSYSIDLHVMLHVSNDENISCIGIAYYREETKKVLEFSQGLVNKPVYSSSNLNNVTKWVEEQIAV